MQARCLVLILAAQALASTLVNAATAEEFGTAINVAGRQRMLSQQMSKEFFLVGFGHEVEANKANLAASIRLFDASLRNLIDGSAELGIPAAPSANALMELNKVTEMWLPFKAILEKNVDTYPINASALDFVRSNNVPLLQQANRAVSRLVDAAVGAGVATAGSQVDTAGRQRMLSQRMSKEVVMMALGMDPPIVAQGLKATMELFQASHVGLLRGQAFLGLPATNNICVLKQMRTVSGIWNDFQKYIREIAFNVQVTSASMVKVATDNPTLLFEMNRAVSLYVSQPSECPQAVSTVDWLQALRTVGYGQLMVWQCGRLFLQVGLKVDVDAGTNTLQIRFTQVESYIRASLEGSEIDGIISPVTQTIADSLLTGWTNWVMFLDVVRKSISYPPISTFDSMVAFAYGEVTMKRMAGALQLYLEAASVSGILPVGTIGMAALVFHLCDLVEQLVFQAFHLEFLGKSSQGTGTVSSAMAKFVSARDTLLEGSKNTTTEPVNRTTDACILRHMQHVSYRWDKLSGAASIFLSNRSQGVLQNLSKFADDLFNPLLGLVDLYLFGAVEGCSLGTSVTEWEASISRATFLNVLSERVATELSLEIRTVDRPVAGRNRLRDAASEIDKILRNLTFGSSAVHVPSPPTQAITDHLWRLTDLWKAFASHTRLDRPDMDPLIAKPDEEAAFLAATRELPSLYEKAALVEPTVQARRIIAAGQQSALVESMTRDLARLGPGEVDAPGRLQRGIEQFEATHERLLAGTNDIPYGELGHMPPTLERPILPQMRITLNAFKSYATRVRAVVAEGYANDNVLSDVLQANQFVTSHTDSSARLYDVARTLASLTPARILVPAPLTGIWMPGHSMKMAAAIAQEIINEQQLLLPGMELTTVFIDDECDDRQGMRRLLEKVTETDAAWVGLGGMACSSVCASTAIVAQSVRLPVISYGCAASYLSDEAAYPGFVRLATPLSQASLIVLELARRFGWSSIQVLYDTGKPHPQNADTLVSDLQARGLAVGLHSVQSGRFTQLEQKAKTFLAEEARQIFIIGDGDFMRRMACASVTTGITPGMTWISSGLKSRQWFNDPGVDLTTLDPRCTREAVSLHLQGAINIAGTGEAEPDTKSAQLDCLATYTSQSFLALFEERLAKAVESGDLATTEIYDGVAGLAADGTCAFAYMIKHMRDKGYDMQQIQTPGTELYQNILDFVGDTLTFHGVSGNVTFIGNDKPGSLGMWQVRRNHSDMVGYVYVNGTLDWNFNSGPDATAWKPHPPGPPPTEFPWLVIPVAFFGVVIIGAFAFGIRHGCRSANYHNSQLRGAPGGAV